MRPRSAMRQDRRFQPSRPGGDPAKANETRSSGRRDRDRVLYSIEFQRLSGVTQVVAPSERFPVHNRLTHSIKVSQVGRSIAERLLALHPDGDLADYLDADVVEAACLAHDLGHPPFGHNSERALDELVSGPAYGTPDPDGFEGNAQSFRVVTQLAARYHRETGIPGLDLTRATLDALLKYPWPQAREGERVAKWGYYATERDAAEFARALAPPAAQGQRSLEADIMDCADDITYGVHDVEDFFRAGLLPLHLLRRDSDEQGAFVHWVSRDRGLSPVTVEGVLNVLELYIVGRYEGRHRDRASLSQLRSSMIDRLITSLGVGSAGGWPRLAMKPGTQAEIDVFKGLTRYYVIESPGVQLQRHGQRRIVTTLFDIYMSQATERNNRERAIQVFPPLYQEEMAEVDPDDLGTLKRMVADLIASLAEVQLADIYAKLTGQTLGSIVDPVL